MNIINIIILIILVLFIIGISLYIYFSLKKTNGGATGTAPPANYCQQYPNAPQCQNIIQCGILSAQTIKRCGPGISTNCSDCQCGENTDPNSRIVCMSCQETDGTFRISVDKGSCTDPFVWNDDLQACFLGTGSYCLPTDTNPNIPCSPYTGFKLLTQPDPKSPYEWKCVCKDDTKFTNDPNTGDCIGIVVCNMKGETNPNVYTPTERALIKANVPTNQTQILWDGTNFDPLKQGKCQCNEDEVFNPVNFSCEIDPCQPGTSTTENKCNCPVGLIDCKSINYDGNINLGKCTSPSCVPDPCYKGNPNNYYVPGFGCVCDDSSDDPSQKWYPYQSKNMVYPTCVQLCNNTNNPCVGDSIQGSCFVPSSKTNPNTVWKFEQAQNLNYWNIRMDSTGSPFYNIDIDSSNRLILNKSAVQTGVTMQIFDLGNTGTNVPNILGGHQYIVQYYNPTSKTLGNFLNVTNQIFDSSVLPTIPNTDGEVNPDYIFSFSAPSQTSPANTGYIIVSNGNENGSQNKNKIYLNADTSNLKIITNPTFDGTARCKCCVQPWTQDDNYFCNNSCDADGSLTSDRRNNKGYCNCCSGTVDPNNPQKCIPNPNEIISNLVCGYDNKTNQKIYCKVSNTQFGCTFFDGSGSLKDYSEGRTVYDCKNK